MTPSQDDPPSASPHYPDPESSTVLPYIRNSPRSSIATLPYRRSNPSLSSLFAATASLPSSLPGSRGSQTPPTTIGSAGVYPPSSALPNRIQSPNSISSSSPDETRNLILRSFVPHVGVVASADTEEILEAKGFPGGLLELLRPYGETIQGKVTIRDSVGASRSWDNFGIRFTGLKDGLGLPSGKSVDMRASISNGNRAPTQPWSRTGGDMEQIEDAVDRHLSYNEFQAGSMLSDYLDGGVDAAGPSDSMSPFYTLYLRRLLSGLPMTPHETFSHPVACIIAISSRNLTPIDELRRLYGSTINGDYRLPQWVNNEFLRYYVLVHDEDRDDISKSTALYDQMKRHFGLHCHLLRLRSAQCLPTDDDSIQLPMCEWLSAAEELAEIQRREMADGLDDLTPHIFESDATAVKTFVRELVTQSVVPSMERLSATWNEQILSRRRGISGRFMSLSKRWTPFGGSSRNTSTPLQGTSSNSNYDSLQGFYRPDAPEALMRKLADYAFMLRDFKLAHSTYDLLRTDFANDKAWKYHAGAYEMTAISTMLLPQTLSSKSRTDTVDQLLETASYSYMTRCASPYNALRTLALGLELLKLRGPPVADDAARWASRIIELRLIGPIGHALFTERVSACYQGRLGLGALRVGSRRRKAAMWAVLAAQAWLKVDKSLQAEKCLSTAISAYKSALSSSHIATSQGDLPSEGKIQFEHIRVFLDDMRENIVAGRLAARGLAGDHNADVENQLEEPEVVSEELDLGRKHRRSVIIPAGSGPLFAGMEGAPLSPITRDREGAEEGFEEGALGQGA